MRIHLPCLAAAVLMAAPASAATRNFGINSFDRIRVDGPYRVQVRTGVPPFARASGTPAGIDRVNVEVLGRTLIVRTNPSWGGYPGSDPGPVEVNIGTHELSQAWLNGSGSLEIDRVTGLAFTLSVQGSGVASISQAEVDQLRVAVGGTGSASVAGRAAKLSAAVRGLSSFDGSALVAKDADLGAEGPATVKTTVTNAAKINASGVGTIALSGNPSCTATVSGSASVSGCRPGR